MLLNVGISLILVNKMIRMRMDWWILMGTEAGSGVKKEDMW